MTVFERESLHSHYIWFYYNPARTAEARQPNDRLKGCLCLETIFEYLVIVTNLLHST